MTGNARRPRTHTGDCGRRTADRRRSGVILHDADVGDGGGQDHLGHLRAETAALGPSNRRSPASEPQRDDHDGALAQQAGVQVLAPVDQVDDERRPSASARSHRIDIESVPTARRPNTCSTRLAVWRRRRRSSTPTSTPSTRPSNSCSIPRCEASPIAVGGGVVLAASYEAKRFGVQAACRGRAKRLCPGPEVRTRPLHRVPAPRRRGHGGAAGLHAARRTHLDRRGVPRRHRLGPPVRAPGVDRRRDPSVASGPSSACPSPWGPPARSTSPRSRPRSPSRTAWSWSSLASSVSSSSRCPSTSSGASDRPAHGWPAGCHTIGQLAAMLADQALDDSSVERSGRSWAARAQRRAGGPDHGRRAGPSARSRRSAVASSARARAVHHGRSLGDRVAGPLARPSVAVERSRWVCASAVAIGVAVVHVAVAGRDDSRSTGWPKRLVRCGAGGPPGGNGRSRCCHLASHLVPAPMLPARAAPSTATRRRPGHGSGPRRGGRVDHCDRRRAGPLRTVGRRLRVRRPVPRSAVPDEFRELAEHEL